MNTAENIVFNLSGGMPLENLTPEEIATLTLEYGVDWFGVLGYTEPPHKRPPQPVVLLQ